MPNEGLISVGASGMDCGLTPLEKRALALTLAGYSLQESTERLGISQQDLGLQLEGICNKLRVSNQLELLLFALYHQLVDPCAESEFPESAHEIELTTINVAPIQQT
jgi:DNA-binding CsgD family transcriptional regulator